MAYTVATLANRTGLTAVDGSPVTGSQLANPAARGLYVQFKYTTTGAPATINVRCAIEASIDGTNWHQLIRFIDQTTTTGATRIGRLPGSAAATEAALTASDLTAAAASATLVDGVLPQFVRAITQLQALTGGASPTVAITVKVMGS